MDWLVPFPGKIAQVAPGTVYSSNPSDLLEEETAIKYLQGSVSLQVETPSTPIGGVSIMLINFSSVPFVEFCLNSVIHFFHSFDCDFKRERRKGFYGYAFAFYGGGDDSMNGLKSPVKCCEGTVAVLCCYINNFHLFSLQIHSGKRHFSPAQKREHFMERLYPCFFPSLGSAVFLSTTTCSSIQEKIFSTSFSSIFGVNRLTRGTIISPAAIAMAPAFMGDLM